jgi:carbon storage regulator
MLVLSRKVGERIVIGSNIEVIILAIEGDRIRLGFVAPRAVSIHRQEIHASLQLDNVAEREIVVGRVANRRLD